MFLTMLRLGFLCPLLVLMGCGGGNGNGKIPEPSTPASEGLFPESSLWDRQVTYRTFKQADRSEAYKVAYSPATGNVCYLLREAGLEDRSRIPSKWKNTIECRTRDGQVLMTRTHDTSGIFKDVLFKPDGSLILAELVLADTGRVSSAPEFFLQLGHYSVQGQLLQQKILEDIPSDQELNFYDISTDDEVTVSSVPQLVDNGRPRIFDNAVVKLKWMNDSLYMLAYTYGVKVYRLSNLLENVWDTQVMPAHTWLWASLLQNNAAFDVNDAGEVIVAFEGYTGEAAAYEQHFGRSLSKTNDSKDIFIEVYSRTGDYLRTLLVGNPVYSENLIGVTSEDRVLWIGANVRHNKNNPESNSDTEWDILLDAVNLQSGENLAYHLIDFEREDVALDFHRLPNRNFLFSGVSGFDQADTNSQITFGQGTVLETDSDGKITRSIALTSPRNVVVYSSAVIDQDNILFSGVFDGPITHTCESDYSLCFQYGVVGAADLHR